jgi:hypothetical protein
MTVLARWEPFREFSTMQDGALLRQLTRPAR